QRQPVLLRGNVAEQLVQMGVDPLLPPYPVCYLGVPLIAGDRLVGMMSIESLSDPDAYGEAELELVKLLAPQAAVALYNADLFSRLSGMTGELSQISDLSQTIGTTLNLELTLNSICQAMIRLMRGDRAGVYLCSEDGQTVSLVASSGLSDDFVAQFRNVPIDNDGLMAHVIRHPQPVSIADVYTDPRALGWRSIAEIEGYAAVATAPMRVNERIIGLLSVFYNVPRAASIEELTLLNTFANQVGAAVATARLFNEAQQRAEDMAHVVESSYTLSESLDLEAIGQALAPRLAQLLALDVVAIFEVNAEGQPLRRLASFGSWPSPDALPGHPTVRTAIRKQQPLTMPERTEDRELLDVLNLQTALVWPLVARSATIGLVVLGSTQPRRFLTRERQLLETLLNQAATALDNARLFQLIDSELDERLRQLSALERVSQRMTAALNVPVVIDEVLKAAISVTYAETASCGLAERPGQLDFTGRIRPAVTQPMVLPIGQGISWRVMRTGQPVLCDDVNLDPDYVASRPGIRSELCVPILSAGKPIGVLDLESIRPAAFNASHEAFLSTLADHAALAIAQARLFAEIRRGNEQMQTILNAIRDGVLLIAADSRLIRNNPAAERLLGRSLAPLVGHSVLRLLILSLREPWAQPEADRLRREFKRRLAALKIDPNRESHGQYRLQTHNAVFEIDESSIPIYDERHQLLARMFVLRDISRERALEHLRDQMTDMLIHDLRSPLASVITSLSLASDQTVHGDFAGLDYVLQIAMQNADDLLLKVESILEVRRMENGQIPLKRVPTSLIEPVRNAIRALEASATDASIQLITRLPDELPPLNIDPFQIARVLINLLDNALKYTPEGKEIRIEAESMPGGRLIKVSVVDTGPGIPANLRRQVFDLFVAFSNQAVRGRRGMGLGLTFCRLMVEAHGGTIWTEAGPEGGAAMNFTLPIAAERIEANTPRPALPV
ncbi:MAG: GAF domain-containing protein, partial [Aggregatilineales bacterium]